MRSIITYRAAGQGHATITRRVSERVPIIKFEFFIDTALSTSVYKVTKFWNWYFWMCFFYKIMI